MDVSGHIGAILNQKDGKVFSIAPDATVFKAIEMMADKNVGALVVMNGEKLVGIISERDYTRKVFLRGKSSKETRVDEIMSGDVTNPSPAGGRWRQSDRDYFHRGFGQARHLLPKRHHRASGKLHQRWVFRVML